MIRSFVRVAALASTCLMGACASSPPMHFYTLARIAPDTSTAVPPGGVPIRLDRVRIPGELDRMQLVQQIDATRLHISDQDRWAAPLEEMIVRVLSADLAARLSPGLVLDPDTPARGERRSLSVNIQEFSMDAGCAITLRADWSLTPVAARFTASAGRVSPGAEADGASGSQELQAPSAGACSGVGSQAELMSRALAGLADRIAAAVARPASTAH